VDNRPHRAVRYMRFSRRTRQICGWPTTLAAAIPRAMDIAQADRITLERALTRVSPAKRRRVRKLLKRKNCPAKGGRLFRNRNTPLATAGAHHDGLLSAYGANQYADSHEDQAANETHDR
jgi:hypothetical protein